MLFPKGDKHMEFEEFLQYYLALDEETKNRLDLYLESCQQVSVPSEKD